MSPSRVYGKGITLLNWFIQGGRIQNLNLRKDIPKYVYDKGYDLLVI